MRGHGLTAFRSEVRMCCRYYIESSAETKAIIEKMQASPLVAKWNRTSKVCVSGEIRPTDVAPVIAPNRAGKKSVFPMKWGFSAQSLLVNARVETASEKPTFQEAWKRRRCIVPATCYYEWEHLTDNQGKKITGDKYLIQPKDAKCVWLCGLYRFENDLPVFVVLTRDAADDIRFIHDRMPLIMPERLIDAWISPDSDPGELVREARTDMIAEKSEWT